MNMMETILTKEQREENIGKIEVLDKVGKLLSIGKTEFSTVKQIAQYFEVSEDSIQRTYQRHKNEIDSDGVKHESSEEIIRLIVHNEQLKIESMSGKKIVDGVKHESSEEIMKKLIEHGVQLKIESMSGKKIVDGITIPNRGMKLFSKRAVLRIGMLLRDSKVAAELRTRLLNIYEAGENTPQNNGKTIVENNLNLIETEKEIRDKWGKAIAEGDNLMANVYATQLASLLTENNKMLNNTISTQNFVINTFNYNRSLTRIFEGTGITARMINKYLIENGYLVRRRRPNGINNNPYPTNKVKPSCYSIKTVQYGAVVKNGETIISSHTEDNLKWTPEGIKFILDTLIEAGFIKIVENKIIKLKDII